MKKTVQIIALLMIVSVSMLSAASYTSLDAAMATGNGRYLLANETVAIEKMPASVEEFTTMRNTLATNPKGAYAMFVIAMLTYVKDKEMGLRFFTLIMDMGKLTRNSSDPANVQGYVPSRSAMASIRQLDTRLYLPGVYLVNTKVDTGYAYTLPASIEFRQATIRGPEAIALYALTTSGNSARPISFTKNDKGIWKASEFSSVFVGVSKIPRVRQIDTL
jgi:hypothetical protein